MPRETDPYSKAYEARRRLNDLRYQLDNTLDPFRREELRKEIAELLPIACPKETR